MAANRRRRWVILGVLAAVVLGGSAGAYAYLRSLREQGNRIKAVSCLRQLPIGVFATTNPSATRPATEPESLWALLRQGGQFVLLRHDLTDPGTGDPPGFDLNDPKTQRNLSAEGRSHAARIGRACRDRGLRIGSVRTSQYARCRDTARLAFGDNAIPEPALNSIYADPTAREVQVETTRRLIGAQAGSAGNTVLVTHQQNITALTGVVPAQGEMVVLTPTVGGGFHVAGRLEVP